MPAGPNITRAPYLVRGSVRRRPLRPVPEVHERLLQGGREEGACMGAPVLPGYMYRGRHRGARKGTVMVAGREFL